MAAFLGFRTRLKVALKGRLSQKNVSTERLVVCQRNKQFHFGEFHVPNGCLAFLAEELEALVDGIRDYLIKESQTWSTRICDVKTGTHDCLEIFIDRKSLFSSCIETVCKEGSDYGKAVADNGQSILLDLVCGSSLSWHEDVTFDDLRALALAQHIQVLLESQGHQVSTTLSKHHLETFSSLMNMLHMNSSDIVHSDLSEEDIQQFMKKSVCHQCCKLKDNFKVYAGSANIPLNHKSESTLDTRHDTKTCTQLKPLLSQPNSVEEMSYEFNIQQFLEEKGYHRDKDNFDKNLHLAEVITKGNPSDVARHVIALEKTMQEKDVSLCLHIVQQNQAFQLQKVHILFEALSQNQKEISQRHLIYGPTTHRKDNLASEDCNVDSYLKLRYEQMREAAVMKYGSAVKGEGWESTIKSVTSAGIKFELLSSTARSKLKLDLSEDDGSNISDSRNGSFVMYNCARLATLFQHFQQAVEKGSKDNHKSLDEFEFRRIQPWTAELAAFDQFKKSFEIYSKYFDDLLSGLYPSLPDIKDVDFSTLREESEWSLMFNYVYMYPETVRQAVEDFVPADGILSKIHTHKVCVFLSGLSRQLSSYYSRTHVLGENRSHLLPTMYARLYLLKAVHQVMKNGLALLGITALTQL